MWEGEIFKNIFYKLSFAFDNRMYLLYKKLVFKSIESGRILWKKTINLQNLISGLRLRGKVFPLKRFILDFRASGREKILSFDSN
ncbi:hypothetical protein CLHUN_28590 [Ruminiclostridium hungatei]|uniref:Uncharacterized protein n=1 Tax=Ruminiclostridium hungatei TaxID=48256 RepID=A0A1V4SJ87_RUMHU|nr:hypothetical protein CLHUN_28590 [Ruminiclostridium hungatei]